MEYIDRRKQQIQRAAREEHEQEHWNEVHTQLLAIQKKSLEVSHPDDPDEKEADEIARKVMNGESAEIHGTGGTINRKGEGTAEATSEFQSKLEGSKGGGQSLDDSTKSEMESKMGADLSGVKIHTGSEANKMNESVNAKAFTHGQDIYFGSNNSPQDKELLAHELVHTVQQEQGKVKPKIQRQADEVLRFVVKFPKEEDIPSYVNDQRTVNIYIYGLIFGVGEAELVAAKINLESGWTPDSLDSRQAIAEKHYSLGIPKWQVDALARDNPDAAVEAEKNQTSDKSGYYGGLGRDQQVKITEETDRLFREQTGIDRQLTQSDEDAYNRMLWKDIRADLLEKRKKVMELPQRTKDYLFAGGRSIEPIDYDKILEAAEIIKGLSDADLIYLKRISAGPSGDLALVNINLRLYVESLPWVTRMYTALDGVGTDEQTVYRILNNRPELVQVINLVYNAKFYPDNSGNMVDDIDGDMDGSDWEFAVMLLGRAGIAVPGEEIPKFVDLGADIWNPDSKGIFSSNPLKTVVMPGDRLWYGLQGHFETYEWGVLYETGNTLIAWDESSAFVPVDEEQLDGNNHLNMKFTDFKFPGVHKILCRVTDENDKITYYSYTQEVRGAEQGISTLEVKYELIAHDMAYRNYLGKGKKVAQNLTGDDLIAAQKDFEGSKLSRTLLKSWGYDDSVIEEDHENEAGNGFFAILIIPQAGRADLNPIIAFRGTSNTPDFVTDSDIQGPGWTQYEKNKTNIAKLIDDANFSAPGKKIDLTGHSLGGALAQWTATDESFKGKFGRVITFQSPAINAARVSTYNTWSLEDKPVSVIHHIIIDDIVPFAGEASMPGTFYTHKTQAFAPFISHTHLMLQSEAYAKQRKELGITDALLASLGWSGSNLPTERNHVLKTSGFPFPGTRADVEAARKAVRAEIDQLLTEINIIKEVSKAILVAQYKAQVASLELYLKLLDATFLF